MRRDGDFEWDDVKAEKNEAKHGVSFEEARTTFDDDHAVFLDDGGNVGRVIVIGFSALARLLSVVHVEIEGDRFRIISARLATRSEHRIYERGE